MDETRELVISQNSVVIFEGIHAINPYFEPSSLGKPFKIFVNTVSPIFAGRKADGRDIRLTRRLLRDERFRNSSVTNTLRCGNRLFAAKTVYVPLCGYRRLSY